MAKTIHWNTSTNSQPGAMKRWLRNSREACLATDVPHSERAESPQDVPNIRKYQGMKDWFATGARPVAATYSMHEAATHLSHVCEGVFR